MAKEKLDELIVRLHEELDERKEEILKMRPEDILGHSYEIAYKTEIAELFDWFYEDDDFEDAEIQMLLNQKNALDYLYSEWLDWDGSVINELSQSCEYGMRKLVKRALY